MWSLIFYETNYNYAKPRFSAQVTTFKTLWLNQPSRRWGVLYVACKRSILVALNQICCGVCLFKCFDLSLCWGGTECKHSPKRQGGQFQLQQIRFWNFWGSAYNRQQWSYEVLIFPKNWERKKRFIKLSDKVFTHTHKLTRCKWLQRRQRQRMKNKGL